MLYNIYLLNKAPKYKGSRLIDRQWGPGYAFASQLLNILTGSFVATMKLYGTRSGLDGVVVEAVPHIGLQAPESRLHTPAQMWTSYNVMNEWKETVGGWGFKTIAFNSKLTAFNKWWTKELHTWHCWRAEKNSNAFEFTVGQLDWVDYTICSKAQWSRALLAEATLLACQFSNQLPEFRERQLPIVVFIQGAHELVDRCRVVSVLWVITKKTPWSLKALCGLQHLQLCKTVLPPIGWV